MAETADDLISKRHELVAWRHEIKGELTRLERDEIRLDTSDLLVFNLSHHDLPNHASRIQGTAQKQDGGRDSRYMHTY